MNFPRRPTKGELEEARKYWQNDISPQQLRERGDVGEVVIALLKYGIEVERKTVKYKDLPHSDLDAKIDAHRPRGNELPPVDFSAAQNAKVLKFGELYEGLSTKKVAHIKNENSPGYLSFTSDSVNKYKRRAAEQVLEQRG